MTSRRDILKTLGLASAAAFMGGPRISFGQSAGGKTFIKVFQRGGADGLHMFPKTADMLYYQHRPNIAIDPASGDASSAINLGAGLPRQMNPNLEPLQEIWDAGSLLVAPSCNFMRRNGSHFVSQRWIGMGGEVDNVDGYLNRFLQLDASQQHPLRGIVAGRNSVSIEMAGTQTVPTITRAAEFDLQNNDFCDGSGCADNRLTEMMREISSHQVNFAATQAIHDSQTVLIETIEEVRAVGTTYTPSAGGLDYSGSRLGNGLRLVAQLLKAGLPIEVASLDWAGSWDTHSRQLAESGDPITDPSGRFNGSAATGATDLLTFWRDMGSMMDNIVVMVCTEFGRTVIENGSMGTDHGHGGSWMVFGGPTNGGFTEDVPTLAEENLTQGRYVPVTVDSRDLVAEIMVRHMGLPEDSVTTVLPGHSFTDHGFFTGPTG